MKSAYSFQQSVMSFTYRVLILVTGVLLLSGCIPGASQQFEGLQAAAEINAALERNVRDADGIINRNALLFIDAPTVDFSYAGAAGIGRVDTKESISADWQFYIASVGKTMTAVIIYQLAEEGAFGDKGVDATLAELDVLPPEVVAALQRIDGVSYGDRITLRQLLTHTAGLRDVFFDGVDNVVSLMPGTAEGTAPGSLIDVVTFNEQLGLTQLVDCTLEGVPAGCNPDDYLFRRKWAHWDYEAWQANPQDKMAGVLNFYLAGMNEHALWMPGEGFHYGDTDYTLLGLVIEKLTGNSLHHEQRVRIFDPLKMNSTYLIGGDDPTTENYEKKLAEVWAWGEPTISGGVDYSFDWGGGGVVSTLEDLNTFTRALVTGELFQQADTLNEMLKVPAGIEGINYASGLIAFPSDDGAVLYMMGSNGTWVEYYPALDLVMIGTSNDFSDMPKQFMLHTEIYQILANQGLDTPMAKLSSLPMTLVILCMILLFALPAMWLVAVLIERRKGVTRARIVRAVRWLTTAAFLANLVMITLVGVVFGENQFQMLFGFSVQVRTLFTITALLMGTYTIVMAIYAVKIWRRKEGTPFEWVMISAMMLVALVYAISIAMLGI